MILGVTKRVIVARGSYFLPTIIVFHGLPDCSSRVLTQLLVPDTDLPIQADDSFLVMPHCKEREGEAVQRLA